MPCGSEATGEPCHNSNQDEWCCASSPRGNRFGPSLQECPVAIRVHAEMHNTLAAETKQRDVVAQKFSRHEKVFQNLVLNSFMPTRPQIVIFGHRENRTKE